MRKFRNNSFVNKNKIVFSNRGKKPANYFLHRSEAKKPKLSYKTILAILGLVLFFVLICFALFSSWLNIKIVEIKGNKVLASETIRNEVSRVAGGKYLFILPKNNLLLFPGQELTEALKTKASILNIKISKNYFKKKLLINLQEKEYNIIWQEGGNYYHINYDGEIILAQNSPENNFLILENKKLDPTNNLASLADEKKVNIDSKYLAYTQQLDAALRTSKRGLTARSYFYDGTANALKIQLVGGPVLIFNTEVEPSSQLHKLDIIRQGDLKDGRLFNSKEYIDLRFGDQVIYRP